MFMIEIMHAQYLYYRLKFLTRKDKKLQLMTNLNMCAPFLCPSWVGGVSAATRCPRRWESRRRPWCPAGPGSAQTSSGLGPTPAWPDAGCRSVTRRPGGPDKMITWFLHCHSTTQFVLTGKAIATNSTIQGIQTRKLPSSYVATYQGWRNLKLYTCPRTTGCKKALVCTKALLARTQINAKARFVNIMI